ncbi:MAG: Crp/Fnr family transcriptional regulator [Geminicoccaceae bacterium]|nr:Crp/Fnr family transcriptional regulator [Geminicoccaceae bacterium]MCB9944707.1 Crp/Fnr family transcriptional regulator [Geminicoccaceae bacterium]
MLANRQEEIRDGLADSDLFGSLYDEELDQLIAFGSIVEVPSGKVIFQRGDPGDCLMIVLSGRVKISNLSVDGKEAVLNFIEPGHCFGEVAMLDGRERSADATCLQACQLFVLKKKDMMAFIESHPGIAWRILGVLCAKVRRASEMVEDSVLLAMEPRIARGLLRLARDYGRKEGSDVHIELRLSQRELGAYVGLARENINRQLSSWRADGLIAMGQGTIVIRQLAELERIAHGDP